MVSVDVYATYWHCGRGYINQMELFTAKRPESGETKFHNTRVELAFEESTGFQPPDSNDYLTSTMNGRRVVSIIDRSPYSSSAVSKLFESMLSLLHMAFVARIPILIENSQGTTNLRACESLLTDTRILLCMNEHDCNYVCNSSRC